jgi:hypothetical protein
VFNILSIPIQSAGLGIPASPDVVDNNMGTYFEVGKIKAPLSTWRSPLGVDTSLTWTQGNALRVVYSIPSGMKNGGSEITAFAGVGTAPALSPLVVKLTAPDTATTFNNSGLEQIISGAGDTRSFITFPGMGMCPVLVTDVKITPSPVELTLSGMHPALDNSILMTDPNNVIHPYHDVYMVRAGVACVVSEGDNNIFYLYDVNDVDPLLVSDRSALTGYRVEGIRAVSFDVDPADTRSVRVWVLAEGDVADSARTGAGRFNDVRDRWVGSGRPLGTTEVLNPEMYYEEFVMTWRVRNLQR